MSRARILADYVSSGDELADKLAVTTAASTYAPIAGPTFTGTVAIPNVANLETAVVANTAKVTNYNQTLADINALDVTELGTVTSANLSNTAIVQSASSVLRVHEFTSQKVVYNTTSNAFVTSGTGTSFTTLANTTSFILNVKGHFMGYENQGDLPTSVFGLFYHSSASATGQTPSGAQIGSNVGLGGYSTHTGINNRWDLYLHYHFLEKISCSGSTTYTIQVCGKKSAADYYLNFEATGTGNIMELSG
jgi:hypothetical protein